MFKIKLHDYFTFLNACNIFILYKNFTNIGLISLYNNKMSGNTCTCTLISKLN